MDLKIKVLLVEGHQLFRNTLRTMLEGLDHIEIVWEAANVNEAINLLRNDIRPDVILLDNEMPEMNGLKATEIIKRNYFGARVILLTSLISKDLQEEVSKKGESCLLSKDSELNDLDDTIKRVAGFDTSISGDGNLNLLKPKTNSKAYLIAELSNRELEILKLVAKGKTSTEIGQQLFISPRTVDTHRNNIIQKLEVQDITGLVHFAVRNNII